METKDWLELLGGVLGFGITVGVLKTGVNGLKVDFKNLLCKIDENILPSINTIERDVAVLKVQVASNVIDVEESKGTGYRHTSEISRLKEWKAEISERLKHITKNVA